MKGPANKDGRASERREKDSRIKAYLDAERAPPLPPIADPYLVEAMLKLGPVRADSMGGRRPTDWPEIWPFMQATGRLTEQWEAETLYAMCCAYMDGLRVGENPFGIAPMDRA